MKNVEAKRLLKILGLHTLTLLDYPGKVACTVFTGGCNLRCPFCHNASMVIDTRDQQVIAQEEVFSFLKKRRGVLDGVCITGGEPLLQPELEGFLRRVREMGYSVKLDTNGCFPQRLKAITAEGLVDYIAMDIKSSPRNYAQAAGISDFDISGVRESIRFLLSGPIDYEFRTTVVKGLHDAEILREAALLIQGAKRYFLQKFEDSGDLIGIGMSGFSEIEMKTFLEVIAPTVQTAALRGV